MRRVLALLAALLTGSAAGVVAAAGPAAAAACPAGRGITVVVGSSVSCDSDGGSPASDNFRDTGHSLTMVDRQPGFVCRVDGAPSSASCVNTPPGDAYWGLFWSNGTSGTWTYASQGVGSLKVPAGGWVALVFQDGARTYPGVTPVGAAAAPTATAKPSARPSAKATPKPTARSARPGSTAAPSPQGGRPGRTAATPTPGAGAAPTPSAAPSSKGAATTPAPSASPTGGAPQSAAPESTDDVERASSDADASSGPGSLGWVAAVLVLALLAGMGAVLWRRKAAGGPS